MINYMRLEDGTALRIEDGAAITNILCVVESEQEGIDVANKFTPANVATVEFFSLGDESTLEDAESYDGELSGEYSDLVINYVYFDVANLKVVVSLREKKEIEKRLDAIEEEQEIQNEAIDFLAME